MAVQLIVGLGNPGPRYEPTRHNLGYRVVDEMARRAGGVWTPAPEALLCRIAADLLLVKPVLFMNRSGLALESLLARWGTPLDELELLVVVDDLDLPLGQLRLKRRGGPGTHNGLRDLCARLGPDFGRLRLGVRGAEPAGDLADYVLSPFGEDEQELVGEMLSRAADTLEMLREKGWSETMSVANRRPPTVQDEDE